MPRIETLILHKMLSSNDEDDIRVAITLIIDSHEFYTPHELSEFCFLTRLKFWRDHRGNSLEPVTMPNFVTKHYRGYTAHKDLWYCYNARGEYFVEQLD